MPWGIALDATSLYVANRNDPAVVARVPIGDFTWTTVLHEDPPSEAFDVATERDGEHLYVGRRKKGLQRITKRGTDAINLSTDEAIQVALDGSDVYFLGHGNLSRVSKHGGETRRLYTSQVELIRFALDGPHVYFTDVGALYRSDRDGSNVVRLLDGLDRPNALAVDEKAIYVAVQFAGAIVKMTK
jgi:hypothetical protein